MVDIKKINLITYASLKHLQGYKILKNPNGTNPYELNMIKYRHELTADCDEVFLYRRIHKTFNGIIPKSSNKTLLSKHIFDTINLKPSKKKNIAIHGVGVMGYFRDRVDVPENILKNRQPLSTSKRTEIQKTLDIKCDNKCNYVPKSNWDVCNEILTIGNSNLNINTSKNLKFNKFIAILKENLSQV